MMWLSSAAARRHVRVKTTGAGEGGQAMFGMFRRKSSGNQPEQKATTGQAQQDEYARMLGRVPLFVDLSRRQLQRLAVACREREYAATEVLLRQGDPGAGLFVLVSGQVRITQRSESGDVHELATLEPGDVFGEMALLDDLPRSATATATQPTSVLILPAVDFRLALHEDADISIRLLAAISRRLRRSESGQL
jgi:CRP/FNR family transcriptional regulator